MGRVDCVEQGEGGMEPGPDGMEPGPDGRGLLQEQRP